MKFDPLVKVVDNKLFLIADNSEISMDNVKIIECKKINEQNISAEESKVIAVLLDWPMVEMEPGAYNEEFLAELRTFLKNLEEKHIFAFIIPSAKKDLEDADMADSFIAAMVHTARRIKDAESVIGFALAKELLVKDASSAFDENSYGQWFINEMNIKHGHYVYFAEKKALEEYALVGKGIDKNLIHY